MDGQAQLLKEHVEYVFERMGQTVNDMSEDELSWSPCRGSNTVEWLLTHVARIGYILIPQVIQGTVKPGGWDDDYEEQPHSLDELLNDLERAHMIIIGGLSEMRDEELAAPLTIWGRETDRKSLLFHLLAELIHHNGQIAMLRGIYNRSGRSG